MKTLLAAAFLLSSLSSYAQVITGGDRLLKDPFEFTILEVWDRSSSGVITVKQSSNGNHAYLYCSADNSYINYTNRADKNMSFLFDSIAKCELVKGCLKTVNKPNGMTVQVDRATLKITKVNLPAECTQDPLAEE